jgi:hypothetical protein
MILYWGIVYSVPAVISYFLAMNHEAPTRTLRADRLGIIASAVCFVHCIATPVVLSLSAVWVHYLPSDEKFHRLMAVTVAGLGGLAATAGYRRHRRARVPVLMGGGLSLILAGAWFGRLMPSHLAEIATTMCGSCLMITAHLFNHTFCKKCDRCDSHESSTQD